MATTTKKKKAGITTLKQAQNALEKHRALKDEVAALMKEHGITKMIENADKLKKEATAWAIENDVEQIMLEDAHATLVRSSFDRRVIGTDEELGELADEDQTGRISLKQIIKNKFGEFGKGSEATRIWNMVTRRVVDMVALDDAISDGVLSLEDVDPAYYERQKAPYLRIFDEG